MPVFIVIVLIVMVMVMLMLVLVVILVLFRVSRQTSQLSLQGVTALHSLQQLGTGQLVPGGGHDHSGGIMRPEQGNRLLHLLGRSHIGVADNDAAGIFHLVVEELAEVFHIHFALPGVDHRGEAVEHGTVGGGILHSPDDIRQLAHTGRLDEDPVRLVFCQHFGQCPAEVANQRTADAPGVHLVDLDPGLCQKAAVNTDLAELILNEHQLFPGISLGDQFLNEGCLPGSQKAGENVDLCHVYRFFLK